MVLCIATVNVLGVILCGVYCESSLYTPVSSDQLTSLWPLLNSAGSLVLICLLTATDSIGLFLAAVGFSTLFAH